MRSHKYLLRFCLPIAAFFLFIWIVPEHAFAQAAAGASLPTTLEEDIATIISKIIAFLNILTWILFILLEYVLDPQFIFDLDANGGFMSILNKIWQLSRDLMNVAFALVLIGTAIYTIITANKDFVTQHAKNFILAVVLVNFSWFVPRVVIDVANVATATIYGVPSLLFPADSSCNYKTSEEEDPDLCKVDTDATTTAGKTIYTCPCKVVTDARVFPSDTDVKALDGNNGWVCQGDIFCYQQKPWSAKTIAGHSAILNGLILNHGHLSTMAQVIPANAGSNIGKMIQFLIREAIVLVIHMALFFPMAAMFIAFLIRIPILWLTMAFMPFVFLSWVVESEYTSMTKEIWNQFLKAAFLPAIIAVPLSVGFILVNAADQLDTNPIEGIQIQLIDSVSDFWELLWWMMTLGVIWIGTFKAFEKAGGLYASTAATIKNYGEAWGRVALKAPLSVPLPALGTTPLGLLKAAHPRNIEAVLGENEGIKGLRNVINNPAGASIDAKAEAFARGPDSKLDELHKDLLNLEKILNDTTGTKTEADKRNAINEIQNKHNVDLTDKTGEKLREFVKKLDEKGVDTKKATRNFDEIAEKLKNAVVH